MNKKDINEKNYQDDFLEQLQQSAAPVAIYLKNGIKLIGTIVTHETYVIILKSSDLIQQMIFKHAVATISLIAGSAERSQRIK